MEAIFKAEAQPFRHKHILKNPWIRQHTQLCPQKTLYTNKIEGQTKHNELFQEVTTNICVKLLNKIALHI